MVRQRRLLPATLGVFIAVAGCREAAAPRPEASLPPGTFQADFSQGVTQRFAGRAQHLVYVSDGTLFVYLTDTVGTGSLGAGGLTFERRAGIPAAPGALAVEPWFAASSGPATSVAISAFLVPAGSGAALSVNFSTLTGSVTIDSSGTGELIGRFSVSGLATTDVGTVPQQISLAGRFSSRIFP